jgi:hypothetical protein
VGELARHVSFFQKKARFFRRNQKKSEIRAIKGNGHDRPVAANGGVLGKVGWEFASFDDHLLR